MNSNLDHHSDFIYQSFIGSLLKDTHNQVSLATENTAFSCDATLSIEMDEIDPLDLEEFNLASKNSDRAAARGEISNFAEIPSMETRFHNLIKQRLQAQIELSPPLFPWETTISDYESEITDSLVTNWVSPVSLWATQLPHFKLPVQMPETVLTQLLDVCSEVVQSSVQQGAKMVQAVKTFFPQEAQLLNQMAGLVLMSPSRSPVVEKQLFNTSYEDATNKQQMALLLLAAKEIINTLSLRLSPHQPIVERHWQTSAGSLHIKAKYQTNGQVSRLLIQVNLPTGGSLQLHTEGEPITVERSSAGHLNCECFNLRLNQTYPLEVRLNDLDEKPLIFGVTVNR